MPDFSHMLFVEWVQYFGNAKDIADIRLLRGGPRRWDFIPFDGPFGEDRASVRQIAEVLRSHDIWTGNPLEIPDDWKCIDDSTPNAAIKTALRAFLSCLEDDDQLWKPHISYKSRSYFTDLAYPSPNVTLHEMMYPDYPVYSVECTILRILSGGDLRYARFHETHRVSHFPSILPAVFSQIRGCEMLRSTPIAFPPYSASFGSSTCASFAGRPLSSYLPKGLPSGFIPIIFAAQRVETLFDLIEQAQIVLPSEPWTRKTQGLVELSKMFEPTLQLFIMHLTKKYQINDDNWRPEWNPHVHHTKDVPYIPEKFFLFGMTYTAIGCVVYAFMPRYHVTKSGRIEWGFLCSEAYKLGWHFGAHDAYYRIQFINTFLRI